MIQKNKTKIILLLSLGLLIQLGLAALAFYWRRHQSMILASNEHGAASLFMASFFFCGAVFFCGLVLLARARGYSGAIVAAAWAGGYLMGCVMPIMAFMGVLLPIAILFALPDKNRVSSKRRDSI